MLYFYVSTVTHVLITPKTASVRLRAIMAPFVSCVTVMKDAASAAAPLNFPKSIRSCHSAG